MRRQLAVLGAVAVTAVGSLSGCGSTEVTAETSCKDYLESPRTVRDDATEQLSSELGERFVAAPMIRVAVDYYCSERGSTKISAYFDRGQ